MKYRPDIDGLRAVAVILVIISHYGFFFSGGFTGVDVFFVISGFVITLSIYPSVKNNTFKISDFWYRRIRRLMPALFSVLITSIFFFSIILAPTDLKLFFQNVIFILLSLSNIFLWREYGGYFGGDAQEAPMLHTWTLSVEEQYYFIWPIALFFLYKILKGRFLFFFLLIVFFATTFISQMGVEKTIAAAYYLLPTRFFELLCGSLLAIFFVDREVRISGLSKNVISIIGIGLIIFSSILLTEKSPFPGYNALYPVIGAALLIISNGGVVNKILSLKPIVMVGKLSYSLYLWHWPILAFLVYMQTDTYVNKAISLVVVLLLSFVSWKYIEQPFRHRNYNNLKTIFKKLYIAPSIFVLTFCFAGLFLDGFKFRFNTNVLAMDASMHTNSNENGCLSKYRSYDAPISDTCLTKVNDEKGRVLLIGDSHANHLRPFLDLMAINKGYSLEEYTLQSCPPIFDINYGKGKYQYERCRKRNEKIMKHLESNIYSAVILSASWQGKNNRRIFDRNGIKITNLEEKERIIFEGLSKTVNYISSMGAVPMIIEDIPGTGNVKFSCPLKKALFDETKSCIATINENIWFSSIAHRIKNKELVIVNLQKLLCEGDKCRIEIDGMPIYRDDVHLNIDGSILLGEKYIKEYGNIFDENESVN